MSCAETAYALCRDVAARLLLHVLCRDCICPVPRRRSTTVAACPVPRLHMPCAETSQHDCCCMSCAETAYALCRDVAARLCRLELTALPHWGPCRDKACLSGLCEYSYRFCGDQDECTFDFCMEDQCVQQSFQTPPHLDPSDAAPVCGQNALVPKVFTLEMVVDSVAWSSHRLLDQLQRCSGYGGRVGEPQSRLALQRYETLPLEAGGDPQAKAVLLLVPAEGEDAVALGQKLVNLLQAGTCTAGLSRAVGDFYQWDNCIAGYSNAAVFVPFCANDPPSKSSAQMVANHKQQRHGMSTAGKVMLALCLVCYVWR
eukprot:g24507.t1